MRQTACLSGHPNPAVAAAEVVWLRLAGALAAVGATWAGQLGRRKQTMKMGKRRFFKVLVAAGRPCPSWLQPRMSLWSTLSIRERPELCVNSPFSAKIKG